MRNAALPLLISLSLLIFAGCSAFNKHNSGGGGSAGPAPTPDSAPVTVPPTIDVTSPLGTYRFGNIMTAHVSPSTWFYFKNGDGDAENCIVNLDETTDFTILDSTCGDTLAPGTGCGVELQANPVTVGSYTANLSLTCKIQGVHRQAVAPIMVSGVVSEPGTIAGSGYFAPTEAGVSSSTVSTFTISNSTSSAFTHCSPTLSNPMDFSISGDGCGSMVQPWSHCTFYVKTNPQTGGTRTSSLAFACADEVTFVFPDQLTVSSYLPNPGWSVGPTATLTQSVSSTDHQETDFYVVNASTYASASNCHPVSVSGDVAAFHVDVSAFNAQVSSAAGFLGPWGIYDRVKVIPAATAAGNYQLRFTFSCDNTAAVGAQTSELIVTLQATP